MSTDRAAGASPAPQPAAPPLTPEQVTRVAALLRPHVPAMAAAQAKAKAAS